MNIQKATEKALKQGKCITRRAFPRGHIRIGVTRENQSGCLDLICGANLKDCKMHVGKYWNPRVEDLLANDWKVI